MKYIKDADYEYILNKYHDTTKPYDGLGDRFKRYDDIFDLSTGMDGEEIKKNILINDEKMEALPHPIRKAYAFEYVLKNTRISCDSRDIFPAINMIDRPLNNTVVKKWYNEVFNDLIPETEKKRSHYEKTGIATMWPDYDHSVPYWDRILSLGFSGILDQGMIAKANLAKTKELTKDE